MNSSGSLGLSVNVFLTPGTAWERGRSTPLYPRRAGPGDAQRKAEVLQLSLSSLRELPIDRILLNVEADPCFPNAIEETATHVRRLFPRAEITREARRPTNVAAWQANARFSAEFFGPTTPIICFYNHDHIFVDHRPAPFLAAIDQVFRTGARHDAFLIYSHTPEGVSLIHDAPAFVGAMRHQLLGTHPLLPVTPAGGGLFAVDYSEHIDAIFVTTAVGLQNLWARAVATDDYVPRPDWKSVSFPGARFHAFQPSREFFRHFDGYGHVTTVRGGLALALDGLGDTGIRPARLLPAVFRSAADTIAPPDLAAEAAGYAEIFLDNFTLALRDVQLARQIGAAPGRPAVHALEELLALFSESYLRSPGELDHLAPAQREELVVRFTHLICAQSAAILRDVQADSALRLGAVPPPRSTATLGDGLRNTLRSYRSHLQRLMGRNSGSP